jgi:hypothetical protein
MKSQKIYLALLLSLAIVSCSKEQGHHAVTSPVEKVSYKIDPTKIGEIYTLQRAMRNGQQVRIQEEAFSEEEFFLYAEALINSMLTDFESIPDKTVERSLHVQFQIENYTLSGLLSYLLDLQQAILNDMSEVDFGPDVDGVPYVHLIDIEWDNGLSIYYLAGVNRLSSPNFFTYSMTNDINSCGRLALNGFMQQGIIDLITSYWTPPQGPPYAPWLYRPNVLYSALWNPGWNGELIPAYTFTELSRVERDYANLNHRHLYIHGPTYSKLWHRTVQGANTQPPCLPDFFPGTTVTAGLGYYIAGAMTLASGPASLNPNQYVPGANPNGLVLIGIHLEAKNAASIILGTGSNDQYEHWHKLSLSYGRQIPIVVNGPPTSND